MGVGEAASEPGFSQIPVSKRPHSDSVRPMFTPRYVKQSKLLLRHAQKYLRYKQDVLGEADGTELRSNVAALETALREKNGDRIKAEAEALDGRLHKLTPVTWEAHWRENCEVILVAI